MSLMYRTIVKCIRLSHCLDRLWPQEQQILFELDNFHLILQ